MESSVPYFLYIHSVLRYFILFFAVIVVVQSLAGLMGRKKFRSSNRMPALMLLIFCDLQLIFGIVLYYYKIVAAGMLGSGMMTDTYKLFFGIEHSLGMVIAIVLVHIGYSITKKNIDDDRKFKRLFWCSFVALAIFMAITPWASRQVVGRPNVPVLPR